MVSGVFSASGRPRLLGLWLLAAAAGAGAQPAGEVEFARGVGFAQHPGQTPRTLGKGLALKEGDRLTTADGASAIIKLEDGTRMTVRPNSEWSCSSTTSRRTRRTTAWSCNWCAAAFGPSPG